MKGIIMAGGEGSRLRPLTADIPKPMVPVANKPAIKHIVEHLHKYGIKDLAVTLFYLPQKIKKYLEEEYGDEIKFYIEDKPLGTAGSVKNARDFLNDTFIVMSGDVITDVNIKEAYEFHRKRGAKVTLILTRVDVPLEYGVVIVDEQGKIKKFLEKPSWGEVFSDTVNTGIYIIEPEILEFIPQDKPFDFSKDLFPMLLKNDIPMYGYITGGYWCDIGNTNQYITSHFDILEGRVDLGYKDKLLKKGKVIGKNVTISPEAKIIPPVIIGDNAIIEANAVVGPNVIIGKNNYIKKGSSLKNAVLWDEIIVDKNCELRGCVVCNRVRIGNNVRIFENSVIGESCKIKSFAEIKPEVKIWPYKIIDEEAVIAKDIVWGNGRKPLTFGYRGIKGVFNEDITSQIAVEIGEVFGNIINSSVLVGHDGDVVSQFISDLISFGLVSGGCEVLKVNNTLLPTLRYGIKKNKCGGGIYVEEEEGNLRILFLDKEGCDIDRNLEKKIENKLRVYDIERVDGKNLKSIREIDINNDYLNFLFKKRTAYKSFKIKPYDEKTKLLLEAVGKNEFFITQESYDVGVLFYKNGEKVKLYDEKGREFDEDELEFIRMLIAKEQGAKKFVLPFDSSKYLTEFAKEFAIETVSSKISHKDRMKTIVSKEGVEKDLQINLNFDGFSFLLDLLEYLQHTSQKLSSIKDSFPLRYRITKSIKCDWRDKGKIIRMLFEKADGGAEFLDGLKFNKEDSWVLVVPDYELPACNIYIEAPTKERAEELFSMYEKEIKSIVQK
jgi:mannose-1-phosphate guanylyltransferase/phosphomannomutase